MLRLVKEENHESFSFADIGNDILPELEQLILIQGRKKSDYAMVGSDAIGVDGSEIRNEVGLILGKKPSRDARSCGLGEVGG
jgi:hypothetical protein